VQSYSHFTLTIGRNVRISPTVWDRQRRECRSVTLGYAGEFKMDHGLEGPCSVVAYEANKTETTLSESAPPATIAVHRSFSSHPSGRRCAYVDRPASAWNGPRFCSAPAEAGSSYCRDHHRRCTAAPSSAEGRVLVAALQWEADHTPEPPLELAYLGSGAIPEPSPPEEPRALLALLDHQPRAEPGDGQ
jgi:hypothetical protein